MTLDDFYGWTGDDYRAITAREFFRRWAQAEIDTIDKGQHDNPIIRRSSMKRLIEFLDTEPTVVLSKELDMDFDKEEANP